MFKKFLNAILFGALILGSAGTITSCKDYDDEIDEINQKIGSLTSKDELSAQISSLQSTLNAAASQAQQGINDAAAAKAAADAAAAAAKAAGDAAAEATAKSAAAEATAKEATAKATAAAVAELQKQVESLKKELSATNEASKKELEAIAKDIKDAQAKMEEAIKSAKNIITDVDILGRLYGPYNMKGDQYFLSENNGWLYYAATLVSKAMVNDAAYKAWVKEGKGKTLTEGQVITSLNGELLVRVGPATLDASTLKFKFVDTQMAVAPLELGAPEAFEGVLTRAENGLWTIPASIAEVGTFKKIEDFDKLFSYEGAPKRLALTEETTGYTSAFNVSITRTTEDMTEEPRWLNSTQKRINGRYTGGSYDFYVSQVPVGEPQTVIFSSYGEYLYDAHLDFDEATIKRWDIKYDGGLTFTVGKLADQITTTTFDMVAHYITYDGVTHADVIRVYPSKSNIEDVTLAGKVITIGNKGGKEVASSAKFSLDPMFEAITGDDLTFWKSDVDASNTTFAIYKIDPKTKSQSYIEGGRAASWDGIVKITTDKNVPAASSVTVTTKTTETYELGVQYFAQVVFYDKNYTKLNTVVVPFSFAIPALTDVLNKEYVVFGDTNDASAYMNIKDFNAYGTAAYSFKYAFHDFADAWKVATNLSFVIDDTKGVITDADGKKHKITEYVALNNTDNADVYIELTDKTKGYNKEVTVNVPFDEKNPVMYLGKYAYSKAQVAAATFTIHVMSPIKEGSLTPAAGKSIEVVATEDGTAQIKESDFKALTYAKVPFKVLTDSEYVDASKSTFKSNNTNVFEVTEVKVNQKDAKGKEVDGTITIKPANAAYDTTENLNVTVTDVWGYTLKAGVPVTVKKSK